MEGICVIDLAPTLYCPIKFITVTMSDKSDVPKYISIEKYFIWSVKRDSLALLVAILEAGDEQVLHDGSMGKFVVSICIAIQQRATACLPRIQGDAPIVCQCAQLLAWHPLHTPLCPLHIQIYRQVFAEIPPKRRFLPPKTTLVPATRPPSSRTIDMSA